MANCGKTGYTARSWAHIGTGRTLSSITIHAALNPLILQALSLRLADT